MKKLLTALALSTLMLSGCGIFRSHHDWKQAKQENPLEIPPSLDRPSTSAALVIPPPANTQSTATAATAAPVAPHNARSLHLADDVATAYKRVGQALERGDLGTVSAQDDATHTYQLQISSQQSLGQSKNFLQKHFSNVQQEQAKSGTLAASNATTTTVTISVNAAPDGGSTVNASGDPARAAHVISVLGGRLGG